MSELYDPINGFGLLVKCLIIGRPDIIDTFLALTAPGEEILACRLPSPA
ncbi:MAG: hypothetical protein MK102_12450 [Fuerstiella sp.]|nr:hypothetical protein [Fuerstiella sp.]